MQNDPELNVKYLGTITKDFVLVADTLKEAAYQIRKRGFSDYPIFAISKTPLPIGQLLIAQQEVENLAWNYYAAMLDEFVQRNLVAEEHVVTFQQAYQDPDEFCCLFVLDNDFARFIFLPYPED